MAIDPILMQPGMIPPEMISITPEEQIKPDLGPDSVPDNEEYKTLVDYCMDDLYGKLKDSDYRVAKIKEIEQSRKVYEQKEDESKTNFPFKDASNITLPLDTITVDNLEPRMVSGLVGTKPVVRFEMEGMTQQDDGTKLLETWFNQELDNKVKIETRAMSVVHIILTEGTGFFIPGYNREEVMQRDFNFDSQTGSVIVGPDGKVVTMDVMKTTYEGGNVEFIPFTDIVCADDIGTIDEWEKADKIRIVRPTYAELMRRKNDIGYLTDKIGPWMVGEKDEGEKKEESQSPAQRVEGVKYTGKETIECAEFYITYQINKDEEAEEKEQKDFTEDRILAMIHLKTRTLIRLCYLRDLNFTNESLIKRVRMFPEEGRSYGTSIYGKIKSIQDGASDFFNAILNIAYIVMLPWFFYEDKSGLRGVFEIKPGQGIPVDSVQGILFPNFNINPSAYLSFIEMFLGLWERLGSVANPQIGRPEDTKKTATEIMMVVQEGNIKFNYQAKTIKEEFISILKTLYDLYYQHMPYDATFNYNGQLVPIPRQMMKRNYKFILKGSTETANKMIERKEADDLYMLLNNSPLANPMTALEELLKSRDKVDLQRYINPQARQLFEAFAQNPEIMQVVGSYLQTKTETEMEITGKPPEKSKGSNARNI